MPSISGVVVDACIIRVMEPECARDHGPTWELVQDILRAIGIAIDEAQKIDEEWLRMSRQPLLGDWLTDELKNGRIRRVRAFLPAEAVKRIHIEYGLPRRGRDIEYIKCAYVTTTRYVLTEDMDLFDPQEKAGTAPAKSRARDQRCGQLCRYLDRQLKIRVGTRQHCRADLTLPASTEDAV